jgi:hypothetical protein
MPDAAYYRRWRAEHPAYRARQNELRNLRRRLHGREDRSRERRPPPPPLAPILPLHTGHDIFSHAKRLARISPGYRYLIHPFYDDLVSEIVLALVEGRSPMEARSKFLRSEYGWRNHALQVKDGFEPHAGRLIPQGDMD